MLKVFVTFLFILLFSCSVPLIKFPEIKELKSIENPTLLEQAKKKNLELLEKNRRLTLVANCKYIDLKGSNSFSFILFTEYPVKVNMEIIYLAKMVMRLISDGEKNSLLVPMEKRIYVSTRAEAVLPDYPIFRLGVADLLSILSYIPSFEGETDLSLKGYEDGNYCLETLAKNGLKRDICFSANFETVKDIVIIDKEGKRYQVNYYFRGSEVSFPERLEIFDFTLKSKMSVEFDQINFSIPDAPELFKESIDSEVSIIELQ